LALSLTGGNAHDITQAEMLAAQVEPEALLGDKRYDTDSFINSLEVRAIKAVIPPKSTRKVKRACDFALYAERNLVARFSMPSSIIEVSQHATKRPRATSLPDCIWSAHSLGSNDDRP
jgi:transposase